MYGRVARPGAPLRLGLETGSVPPSGGGARDGWRLQAIEIGNGLLGLGGGGEQGARVGLHHLEPVMNVAGMIGVRFGRNAKARAKKRGATFGAGFFEAIGVVAEAQAEVAVQAVRCTGPVSRLMSEHGIPRLGAGASIGFDETGLVRNVDGIGGGPIVSLPAADQDFGTRRGEIGVGGGDALNRVNRRGKPIAAVATARKMTTIIWHLLTKNEDYAFGRPALLQAKLRQMEIKAGLPSKRGGNTPGRARDYNIKSLREQERALVAQAEAAYSRFVAAWSERPKDKNKGRRAGAAKEERR